MKIGDRIKIRREYLQMTQDELARKLGYRSRSSINKIERDASGLPQNKIVDIARALQVSPAYLMGWEEEHPKNILPVPDIVKKPRLGVISCGKPILAVEEADIFDNVPASIECDFTLLCKGDSMINARIFDGDIVYIQKTDSVDNGEIAAVLIEDEATLKRVYYTPGSDRITLRACNPMYPDMEYSGTTLDQIRILGRAVAFTSIVR